MSKKEKEVGLVLLLLAVILVCAWFIYHSMTQEAVPVPAVTSSVTTSHPALTDNEKDQILASLGTSTLSASQKSKIIASMGPKLTSKNIPISDAEKARIFQSMSH